jgi:hypothetical protein
MTPGFNGFDGAFCDAPATAFPAFRVVVLPDLLAVFVPGVLGDFTDWTPATLREAVLGDFLRVFLDIRLPFVAFGGSTMGIAGLRNQAGRWASLMAPEYGYREFDAPPVRPLTALAGPDDK